MRKRGADILVQTLQQAGVEHIFTLSGNHIMSIFDAVLDSHIKLIHVRHEAAAVHMADASARITGKPGIALVTAGPGHANAISALYTAACSESPVVLLSGRAPRYEFGRGAFQEMEQADLARPVTKASWTVASTESLCADIAKAMRVAQSGRPGPVHLSLPSDVLEEELKGAVIPNLSAESFVPDESEISPALLVQAVDAFRHANCPLVVCGPAVATAAARQARQSFVDKTGVPILVLESPRGVNDPSMGRLASVLAEVDAVLLLGKRLDFMLRFGNAFDTACRKVSAVDIDAITSLALLGDAIVAESRWRDWHQRVQDETSYRPAEWKDGLTVQGRPIHPLDICMEVQAILNSDVNSVLICDGGEFGQWAQAALKAELRLINGPAGAIGAALPFAIGTRLVLKEKAPVIAMMGDGTFGFHMAELDTACRYGLPILVVIGNDQCWNAEYQIQLRSYGMKRALGCELRPVRYDQVVEKLGGHGEFVERIAELRPALLRAMQSGLPACINVMMDRVAAPSYSSQRETPSSLVDTWWLTA